MRLDQLVAGVGDVRVVGDGAAEVTGLAYDSRKVGPGALFFCISGEKADGLAFAEDAVNSGAVALVVDEGRERELPTPGVPLVLVRDARAAMAPLAARFYGDPTSELKVVGVTGTNGKTTTAFLIWEVLKFCGVQCGLLGTVQQVVGGKDRPAERTTPESIDLQATFRQMIDGGDRVCVMEVSSHALTLHRCDSIHFEIALFTNLTQDHLDFHSDMDEYFAAKRLLFEMGPKTAIVNVDDPYGQRLAREFKCLTFSAGNKAHIYATDQDLRANGASFTVNEPAGGLKSFAGAQSHPPIGVVETRLPGDFNISNALGAFAAATRLEGIEPDIAAAGLAHAKAPPGRVEPVHEGQPFSVLVDYAHTPDSLENVLRAARIFTSGRLIVVVGAGGDRDKDKRPKMGRAATNCADFVFLTSDNPRSEDPEAIIAELKAGTRESGSVQTVTDRREAIAKALAFANPGDTVVIAGKGHEQGQELEGGRKIPFDDREVARQELRRLTRAEPA